jgi:hypothetical protein
MCVVLIFIKFEVNSCASESQAVPAPIVTPLKYVTNMYPTRFIQLALQCEGISSGRILCTVC